MKIRAIALSLMLLAIPASAHAQSRILYGSPIPDSYHCWQDYSSCWGAWIYAFPDLPYWNANTAPNITNPPPTKLAEPQDWNPRFPNPTEAMQWSIIPGDRCLRWAWINIFSANLSSYERGQSVGGADGPLAATQDGIHPTPVLPKCAS